MNRLLVPIAFAALMSGCATLEPQLISLQSTWDSTAAAFITQNGNNTIKGNAFMRQRGGGVVTCAGQTVTLIPATLYAIERIGQLYGPSETGFNANRNLRFSPDPAEYQSMTRKSTCDSQGNFIFERVADGDYFVVLSVNWIVGYTQQGGNLMHRIRVANAAQASLIMSR